ncbi:ubiquinol-cytochrome C reductase [Serratia aquatilis]|uniref:Ubiquinol-cytochrome C reductase n=1 Tax=Serratia aquatilis TaxID=1737515 RepID=A0ABV6EGY1_9GAMM
MRKDAYWLINDGSNIPLEEAAELEMVASGVHDSIIDGISAIGSLMFWAAESENYNGDQAKRDMYFLGDMLKNIARMAQGVMDAEENISSRRSREKKQ